jgi:hypothetical protein
VRRGMGRVRQAVIAAGGIAAMLGLFWDDAWHTDVGRDDLVSPPHLLLYAGVAVLLVVIADWVLRRYATEGRLVLRDPAVVLPLFGALVTLAAAPVDEVWHRLFGRDAVVWSPPHMVAVAGMTAFAAGLLLAAHRGTASRSRLATAVIGAFLIAAAGAAVMEYEADVPQFAVVWYLPALLAGLTLTFALIHKAVSSGWGVTAAAGVHMLIRTGVLGFLAALGHSLPTVMPTVVPALAFEAALRRGWTRGRVAGAVTVATVVSHVPAHALQPAGLSFTAADVVVGALLGGISARWVLALVQLGRTPTTRRISRLGVPALLLTGLGSWSAAPASAHDPGQGVEVAPVHLQGARVGDVIQLTVDGEACESWSPVRLVARRGGETLIAPLEDRAACTFVGEVAVGDPGRWFVYAEIDVDGRRTEAWIPVRRGSQEKRTDLYVSSDGGPHGVQVVSGALLYGVVLAILAAVVVAYRRVDRLSGVQPREAPAGVAPDSAPRNVER